jgi:hypothetical protein
MILDVASNENGRSVLVGSNGLIRVSDDGGSTWQDRASGTEYDLNCVAYGSLVIGEYFDESWVVGGDNGKILVSRTGDSWEQVSSPVNANWNSIDFNMIFYMVGSDGNCVLSSNLGWDWEFLPLPTEENLVSVDVDSGAYLIVGDNDTVLYGKIATNELNAFLLDGVGTSTGLYETGSFNHSYADALEVYSSSGDIHYDNITEHVSSYDFSIRPTGSYNHNVEEIFGFLSQHICSASLINELVDHIKNYDWAAFKRALSMVDGINANSIVDFYQYYAGIVNDTAIIDSTFNSNAYIESLILQKVNVFDKLLIAQVALLYEGVTFEDSIEYNIKKAVRVFERISIEQSPESAAELLQSISICLSFLESISAAKGAEASVSLSVMDSLLHRASYYSALIEEFFVDQTQSMSITFSFPVSEICNMKDGTSALAHMRLLIQDGVCFSITFNTPNDAFTGWVLNTESFAVSEYSNYPFNSFAQIAGKYYGANSNGLYLLEGDTDAGESINAYASLGLTNFGEPRTKRMRAAHIGIRSDGKTLLRVKTDNNETKYYEIEESKGGLSSKKVPMQRSLLSTYWHFTLENVNGSDFELDSFEFIPVVLNRRG